MLALLLLAVALGGGWVLVVQPLAGLLGEAEGVQELRVQRDRLAAMAARRPTLERQVRGLRAQLTDTALLWPGTGPAMVAASVQTALRDLVAAAGGTVRSTADSAPVAVDGMVRVALVLDASIPYAGVPVLLDAIAANRPVLLVTQFSLIAAEPSGAAQPPAPVALRLEISTFMRAAP